MWEKAYSRLTEKGLVTTVRLGGGTSGGACELPGGAPLWLAEVTGGEGLSALVEPRPSLGEPSPIGGVLEVGGELDVATVSSPKRKQNSLNMNTVISH